MMIGSVQMEKGKKMARYIDSNKELPLKSAISAKQTAYNNYKRLFVKWLDSTWIGDDGEFCYLKNNYFDLVEKADEEFKRASIEVEHYRMEVRNQDGEIH